MEAKKGRKKPTAIDAYECYECKTRHTTENMVAYCAACYSKLTTQCLSLQAQLREARSENERMRKIEAASVALINTQPTEESLCRAKYHADPDHDHCSSRPKEDRP